MSDCSPPGNVAIPTKVSSPEKDNEPVSVGISCDTKVKNATYAEKLEDVSKTCVKKEKMPQDLLEGASQITYGSLYSPAVLYNLLDGTRVAKMLPPYTILHTYIEDVRLCKEFLAWNYVTDLFANTSDIPACLQHKVYIPSNNEIVLGMYKEWPTLILPRFTYTLGDFAKYCLEKKTGEKTDEDRMLARKELVCLLETIPKLYAFLHVNLGFIHGDLHSGNLMVTKKEDDWRITFIDFGETSMNITAPKWKKVTDLVHPRFSWKPVEELQELQKSLQSKLCGKFDTDLLDSLPTAEELFRIFESFVHVLERPPKRRKR